MERKEIKTMLEGEFKDCPEPLRRQMGSMIDAGLLDVDAAKLLEEEKSCRHALIHRLSKDEYDEMCSKIPQLDESQKRLQVDYLRVLILLQDIARTAENFDEAIKNGDFLEGFRELRMGLLAYYLSDDARKNFSRYGKDDAEICELSRKLAPRTTFLAHMRNYVAGHLDAVVLEKTCQWGGFSIFTKSSMCAPALMILVNKFLFETGINCCIASKPDDKKVIKNEIDLTYPPDYEYFMGFMSETYDLTYKFLNRIKEKIEVQLKTYDSPKEMLERAIWAGATDFAVE